MVRELTQDMAREVLGRCHQLGTLAGIDVDDVALDHLQVANKETGNRKMLTLLEVPGLAEDPQRVAELTTLLEIARELQGDELTEFMRDHLIRPDEQEIFRELAEAHGKLLRAQQKAEAEQPSADERMERLILVDRYRKDLAVTNEQLRKEGLILDEGNNSVTLDKAALEELAGVDHKTARQEYVKSEAKKLGLE